MQAGGRARPAPGRLDQHESSQPDHLKHETNFNAPRVRGVAGKVYVSHIVDYLRHTTSRSSQDSGLEELCNMLDPEHKDVSIDLDTYHAVMREWIDDCRNNG